MYDGRDSPEIQVVGEITRETGCRGEAWGAYIGCWKITYQDSTGVMIVCEVKGF